MVADYSQRVSLSHPQQRVGQRVGHAPPTRDTAPEDRRDLVSRRWRCPLEEDLLDTIRSAQRGDAIAMNALLDHLTPVVTRICGPIALDSGADATQETLIVVFRNLQSIREPAALYGWVARIATREAIRVARKASRTTTWAVFPELPARGSEALGVDITDTLGRLSPEHRAILVLRDLEGFSEEEAARMLTIPGGTAKSRLHRARSLFRKAWQ